jgi:hypothetical protein
MNFYKYFVILMALTLFLLTGCASRRQPITSFTFPEIGSVTTKNVGENLLIQGTGQLVSNLIIPQDEMIGNYLLHKGEYIFDAENSTRIKFKKDNLEIYLYKADNKICVDKEQCAVVAYSLEKKIGKRSINSFQQNLLYNGKIGNRIMLGYREFSSNLARAAFSNEVAYDLAESKILGYKGARIEVIMATNTEITYKILSGFE